MTPESLTAQLYRLLDDRAEMEKVLRAYPVQDGTNAVLRLIEEVQR